VDSTDTQISMLPGKPESAMCVQNFNDSRGIAIRITYRISLRSSSLWEPRHPSLKVVSFHLRWKIKSSPPNRGTRSSFPLHFRSLGLDQLLWKHGTVVTLLLPPHAVIKQEQVGIQETHQNILYLTRKDRGSVW
jgi:hypothetical protein